MARMRWRWLTAGAMLSLALVVGRAQGDDGQAPEAAVCQEPELSALLGGISPVAGQVVWSSHDGCHAQLTCDSNCVKQCSGTTCSVGPDYVECDGQKKFCPSCNLSEYPGYPICGLRQCPWCACMSAGGTMEECCAPIGP